MGAMTYPLEATMANILIYYPFTEETQWGRSVKFTLNPTNHAKNNITFISEKDSDAIKQFEFDKIKSSISNKLYIVGHCGAGDNTLGAEGGKEEIHYKDLANKISKCTRDGKSMKATIKILACESGAAQSGAASRFAKELDYFGYHVPKPFLSFAQKLWNTLVFDYSFLGCECYAYTKPILWNSYMVESSPGKRIAHPLQKGVYTHRFFIDDDGNTQRARECRIRIIAQQRSTAQVIVPHIGGLNSPTDYL
jgi:hypothetical protein